MSNKRDPKQHLIRMAVWFLFWFLTILYYEFLLHTTVFTELNASFFYVIGFSIAIGAALSLLFSFIPRKYSYWIALGLTCLLLLLYGSQMVYYFVFGSLYSVSLVQQGGAALTSFWRETLQTMWENLLKLLLLGLPVGCLLGFRKFFRKKMARFTYQWRLLLLGVSILSFFVTLLCLPIGGTGYFSTYYYYYSSETTTDQAADRFGLMMAMGLELTGSDSGSSNLYVPQEDLQAEPEEDNNLATDETEETAPPELPYNVLEIDFNKLNSLTSNKTIKEINNYCASLPGTQQNEYTGMLSDYNLIYICAESFDTGAIHPELTPTLYKLANNGFIFNNYYNTYPNVTTDGEYTMCLGLYPDTNRGKRDASFKASQKNYLPYALGNIFAAEKGITPYGYHNYKGSYYTRNKTHPNMGYTMKFMNSGMKFTTSWPSSDLEMMKQSVDDYIGQEQFHAYYMTFSGHYQYNTETNLIAKRNWDAVKGLDLSNTAKAYLSCHIELDKALEYLMQKLEEAGVADKTAIVLAGDHFPYGLKNKQYSELVGYELDNFNKFKSTLIFWVGGLEENIQVDTYCCNADILPTVLNLWGMPYDSRLLAGTDVFSDGTHVAILRDYSFFTDKVWFNASKSKVEYLVPEEELPEGYLDNMIKLVKTKYSISKSILDKDYYRFVYDNM